MDGTDQKIDTPLARGSSRVVRYELIDKDGRVTSARLRELLAYDSISGLFRWKVPRNGFIQAGDLAGSLTSLGYVEIQIDGCDYRAHNLAWLYFTGEWPKTLLDHRDLNEANNAFLNLREATLAQQQANRRATKANKLGVKGVSIHKKTGKYVAQIKVNGHARHLGLFNTIPEASAAYEKAAIEAWGEFARAS